MPSTEYFVRRAGTVSGPFTLKLLLAGIKLKKVVDSDSVSTAKNGPWLSVAVFQLNYTDILDDHESSSTSDRYFEDAAAKRQRLEEDTSHDLVESDTSSTSLSRPSFHVTTTSTQRKDNHMEDDEVAFLQAAFDPSFTSFVTPRIIRFLFMLTCFVIAPLGILGIVVSAAINGGAGAALGAALGCGIGYLFLVLYLRVASEIAIVLFRIERNTR